MNNVSSFANVAVTVIDCPTIDPGKVLIAEYSDTTNILVFKDILGNIKHVSSKICKAYEVVTTGVMNFMDEHNYLYCIRK